MISIIIPTLNEEEGIAKVICSIPEKIRQESELIVVDASDDLTPVIAQKLGATVLKEARKGKGWQMRQAVAKSKGDILVFLDGDGTDPAQYVPHLVKKLDNAQLVLGCRSLKKTQDPKMYQYFKFWKFIAYPMNHMLGLNLSDPLAGFRAIRRTDWDTLNLQSNEFEIETEMNIRAIEEGFTIEQILIPNLKRAGGFGGSKFARNPTQWVKIYKMMADYQKKKMKSTV